MSTEALYLRDTRIWYHGYAQDVDNTITTTPVVKMKVLTDEGGGVTEESLEYFYKHFHEIGRIFRITCSFDERTFNTELEGEKGIMLLSGLSCGYPGTGPRGLHNLLSLLGWVGNFQDIAGTHLFETRL